MDYETFLASKRREAATYGIDVADDAISPVLFPFQRAIVKWSVLRGRAAIFADCGMGKTIMQLEWARLMGSNVLIVAPLSVAHQTVREAKKLGMDVRYVRDDSDPSGFRITNYEHVHKINTSRLDAVVLDESSILKNSAGSTRTELIEAFRDVRYRLACTATPSPNDHEELTNHSEFLGVGPRVEVLASYFVHDEDGWRLKGHAKTPFYDWVATWAVSVRRPSDIGYADEAFVLPPLDIISVPIASPSAEGELFGSSLAGVQGRTKERRATLDSRCAAAVELATATKDQVIVWTGMNAESETISREIPDAVEITGSDDPDDKEFALMSFIEGRTRVLVTKPSICGFGLNLQNAAKMIFVGMSDSYESYYQSIRRCYRFGQKRPVTAWVIHTEAEGAIVDNVKRKESDAQELAAELVERCAATSGIALGELKSDRTYSKPTKNVATGDGWEIRNDDCIAQLESLPENSVDFTIFSPPFASLYTYSDSLQDMGNCSSLESFAEHFRFFAPLLLRAIKPGRIAAVHVSQIASTMQNDGFIGIKDFRGLVMNEFKRAGWIHHGEITVDKCPQAQAIRTKSKSLLFVQKERDASWLRPALADYVLLFRKPGDNAVPIQNEDVTREDWIEWARPVWYGIRESNTLNAAEGRSEEDERHICPLQLDLIKRCIRLWSNRGEMVLSPFAGIGSEGYVAIEESRRFLGFELKQEYFNTAIRNLTRAERSKDQLNLFAETA